MCARVIAEPIEIEDGSTGGITSVVGDRLSTSTAVREHHGHGEGFPVVFSRRAPWSLLIRRKRSARLSNSVQRARFL